MSSTVRLLRRVFLLSLLTLACSFEIIPDGISSWDGGAGASNDATFSSDLLDQPAISFTISAEKCGEGDYSVSSSGDADSFTVTFTNSEEITSDITYCVEIKLNLDGGDNPLLASLEYSVEVSASGEGGTIFEEFASSNSLGFETNIQDPILQSLSLDSDAPEVTFSMPSGTIVFGDAISITSQSSNSDVLLRMGLAECQHPDGSWYELTVSGCDTPSNTITCELDGLSLDNFVLSSTLTLRFTLDWSMNGFGARVRHLRDDVLFDGEVYRRDDDDVTKEQAETSTTTGDGEYLLKLQIQKYQEVSSSSDTAPMTYVIIAIGSFVGFVTLGFILWAVMSGNNHAAAVEESSLV